MFPDQHTAQEHEDMGPGDEKAAGPETGRKTGPQDPSSRDTSPVAEASPDKSTAGEGIQIGEKPGAAGGHADGGGPGGQGPDGDPLGSGQPRDEPVSGDPASRLMAAEQRIEEQKAAMLRLQAEMENLRKRSEREVENAHKYGLDRFVLELLPVKDSMELGVGAAGGENVDTGAIREGMTLTLKMFMAAMEKFGVEEVSPAPGERFDHERHQAISVQEDKDKESGSILVIVQKGCLLNGRLIRPAMVIVAK